MPTRGSWRTYSVGVPSVGLPEYELRSQHVSMSADRENILVRAHLLPRNPVYFLPLTSGQCPELSMSIMETFRKGSYHLLQCLLFHPSGTLSIRPFKSSGEETAVFPLFLCMFFYFIFLSIFISAEEQPTD